MRQNGITDIAQLKADCTAAQAAVGGLHSGRKVQTASYSPLGLYSAGSDGYRADSLRIEDTSELERNSSSAKRLREGNLLHPTQLHLLAKYDA